MIFLDIINNIDNIENDNMINKSIEIIFDDDINDTLNFYDNNPYFNISTKIQFKVIEFLGKGAFGCVYKIEFNKKFYAIKLNSNEIPNKLYDRYVSLYKNKKLNKYIIKIFCCGNVVNSNKYKYYSIMEYGGTVLKVKNCIYDQSTLYLIIHQLIFIVYNIIQNKIIITDFKLSNLTIDDNYDIKLIDLYIYCDDYDTHKGCEIVNTYVPIEIQKYSKIFENESDYNYTYICIPLIFCLIDLLCKFSIVIYINKLAKKYNINNVKIKDMIGIIQISSYYYNYNLNNNIKSTNNNDFIHNNKNVVNYVKMMIHKYPFITSDKFYEFFINSIQIKDEYFNFIPINNFLLLINDFINLDPNKRYIEMMLELVKLIKPKRRTI